MSDRSSNPLRIVTFNNLPAAFDAVQGWAAAAGHTVVLAVTSPGPKTRRSAGYREIAATAGEKNIELLISTRIKTVVTPAVAALKPDLIVSFTFPWRLTPELLAIPRLGAINLHPTLLPAYRGPNVMRQFFDASPRIGATLHWMDAEFDTGPILSQHSVALPRPCTAQTAFGAWQSAIMAALVEGAERAIAGERGTPQPTAGASYAGAFTEAEYWLDLTEAASALQCKAMALSLFAGPSVKTRVNGVAWAITRIDLADTPAGSHTPGSVIETLPDGLIVQTSEGVARLIAKPV